MTTFFTVYLVVILNLNWTGPPVQVFFNPYHACYLGQMEFFKPVIWKIEFPEDGGLMRAQKMKCHPSDSLTYPVPDEPIDDE